MRLLVLVVVSVQIVQVSRITLKVTKLQKIAAREDAGCLPGWK